jgi:anthranilate/para-aminobenzoate synthase component II
VILVIDNYDSFTFNLVQALEAARASVRVVRNDALDRPALEALGDNPAEPLRGILISPGPGGPDDAGIYAEAIRMAT